MLEDGDGGFFDDGADEAFAAAGDDDVDVVVEFQERRQERAVGGFDELDGGRIDFHLDERLGDDGGDGGVGEHRLLAAAKDDGSAGFETEGGGVGSDIGAAFVDEQDDAERHA